MLIYTLKIIKLVKLNSKLKESVVVKYGKNGSKKKNWAQIQKIQIVKNGKRKRCTTLMEDQKFARSKHNTVKTQNWISINRRTDGLKPIGTACGITKISKQLSRSNRFAQNAK